MRRWSACCLLALYARQQTGRGDHVDISMADASVVTNDGMHYALEGMKVGVTNEVHETVEGCSCRRRVQIS